MKLHVKAREAGRPFGSRGGNAMVEFALSATVLVFVFTGVFQFGYSFYVYNELENAVRMGVRYASLQKLSNAGDGTVPAAFTTAVQNVVVYGTPSPANGATPIVVGLATTNVSAPVFTWDSGNVPQTVAVSIGSYTINAVVQSYTLTGKPVLTMPYFGQYCSSGTSCP